MNRRLLYFAAGVVAAFLAALVLFDLLLDPSEADLRALALFLASTAAFSIAVGYVATRLRWMRGSPHVSWTLLASFLLTGALAFLNVFATARLMFVSRHYLLLASVLLIFAGGIAMSFGYLTSGPVADRLTRPRIDPGALPRVFDTFFRGDHSRPQGVGGAGLGLAIGRGIVEAHGGRVGVESRPGRGSRFCFVLPKNGTREGRP